MIKAMKIDENSKRERKKERGHFTINGYERRKKKNYHKTLKFREERKHGRTGRLMDMKEVSRAKSCLSCARPPSPPLSLYPSFLFLSLAAPLLSASEQNDLVYKNKSRRPT